MQSIRFAFYKIIINNNYFWYYSLPNAIDICNYSILTRIMLILLTFFLPVLYGSRNDLYFYSCIPKK